MRLSRWFGLAILRSRLHDEIDRAGQIDHMTRRNINRRDPLFRSHYGADHFSTINERRLTSGLVGKLTVFADEDTFCASDRDDFE
jgi:hypothetical protein